MKNPLNRIIVLLLAIISLLYSSCEKIIDLNLDKSEPKIVIEAFLTDSNVRHIVSLSSTTNFDANNTKVPVKDAVVSIKEENGPTINYVEQTPGYYISTIYKGVPGKKYTITIVSNGKTYTASSTMPLPVPIKFLSQTELTAFGETRKIVQVNYADPIGIANFYYNRVFVNDVKLDVFYVDSDRFTDGKGVRNNIFIDEPDLVTGDKVKIQLLTIDKNVYNYLFSITQITGNGGPPTTPANPTSNFNNGALGFFSASTLTVDSLTIQ